MKFFYFFLFKIYLQAIKNNRYKDYTNLYINFNKFPKSYLLLFYPLYIIRLY